MQKSAIGYFNCNCFRIPSGTFPHTAESAPPNGILSLINREICCGFTHMLVTDGIDPDANPTPLCGSL